MKPDNFIKVVSQIRKVGIPKDVQEIAKTFINNDKMDQGEALAAAFKLADVKPNSVQKYAIDILANPQAYNYGYQVYGYPRALANSRGVINAMKTNSHFEIKGLPAMNLVKDYENVKKVKRDLSVRGNTVKQVKILQALGLVD